MTQPQTLIIEGRLPGANEYQRANRTHYHVGAKMKRQAQDTVCAAIRKAKLKPYSGAVIIHYTFYEAPKRRGAKLRDKSNISSFAIKVIEDALQETGIIKNDNWDYLADYSCKFFRASEQPRVVVELEASSIETIN